MLEKKKTLRVQEEAGKYKKLFNYNCFAPIFCIIKHARACTCRDIFFNVSFFLCITHRRTEITFFEWLWKNFSMSKRKNYVFSAQLQSNNKLCKCTCARVCEVFIKSLGFCSTFKKLHE